jgi:hypothetical protein
MMLFDELGGGNRRAGPLLVMGRGVRRARLSHPLASFVEIDPDSVPIIPVTSPQRPEFLENRQEIARREE